MSPDDGARAPFLLITCEHGGRDVPAEYAPLFADAEAVLASHRGSDIGALGVALRMAANLSTPVVFSTVTRLLIDLNRSLGRPDTFSEFTRGLSDEARSEIIRRFYTPHRRSIDRIIDATIGSGSVVVHIGVHSCTDVLEGHVRELDISLLFDESREAEADLCERWRDRLRARDASLRLPFNEPYRGADDGLTTSLRDRHAPKSYLGIETELRQSTIRTEEGQLRIADLLTDTLRATIEPRIRTN